MSDTKEALRKLIDAGVATEKEVLDTTGVDVNEPSAQLKEVAELLHSTLCSLSHQGDNINACLFYGEGTLDSRWQEPHHIHWIGVATKFRDELEVGDEFLLTLVAKASALLSHAVDRMAASPAAIKLFVKMWQVMWLNWTGLRFKGHIDDSDLPANISLFEDSDLITTEKRIADLYNRPND